MFSHAGFWIWGVATLLFLLMHSNHVFCVHLNLVQRIYFWHFTNPRHTVKTRYIIPILPGISRVPYGDTVLHVNYIVRLPSIPEAVKGNIGDFKSQEKETMLAEVYVPPGFIAV